MAEIIAFPERATGGSLRDFTGRVLALNPEKARRFQCGGFWLSQNRSHSRVPAEAAHAQLAIAVADGRLLDITDSIEDYTRGGSLIVAGNEISRAQEEDTGKKAYLLKINGQLTMVAPETPEQQADIERQIAAGKTALDLPPGMDNPDKYLLSVNRMSPVWTKDIEPAEQTPSQ